MLPVVFVSLALSPAIYLTGRLHILASRTISLIALMILWLIFGFIARDFNSSGTQIFTQGTLDFSFDGVSLLVTTILLILSTLVIVFSIPDVRGKPSEEKYYAILLLMTGAVIGFVSAGDLFNLWVWFELTAISSYLLVAFYRENSNALAACAKYLMQTATGSILVLFGVALIFAQSGQLDFAHIQIAASPLVIVAGTFFILGFGVKIALFPSYTWLADAYAESPSGVSALLSGIITISGLGALLRVLGLLSAEAINWGPVLLGLGTLNITLGNFLALRQSEVKRIFAYSSMGHIGFIVFAVGISICTHQSAGFQGGMLHLFIHGLMKSLAFFAVGAVIYMRNMELPLRVNDLSGIAHREPLLAISIVIACLSLAGVPPLAGFVSKLQIFYSGVTTENLPIIVLTIFAALNSVFSLAYYFPIINALFQEESTLPQRKLPLGIYIPVYLLTGALFLIGIQPAILNVVVVPAAQTLTALFGG